MREVHTCQSKRENFSYSDVLKAGNSGLARTVRNKTGSKRGKWENVVNFSQGSVIRVLNVKFWYWDLFSVYFLLWSQCFLLMCKMSVNVVSYHNTSQDCGIGE